MDEARLDQIVQALENDDLERAVLLVRGATGASEKQAMDVVLTLMEGLDEAQALGL